MVRKIASAPIPHERPILDALGPMPRQRPYGAVASSDAADPAAVSADIPSFIFGEGTKAKTPADAARLRAIAQSLGNDKPTSFGTGLTAIGDALVSRKYMDDASAAETAGQAHAADAFKALTAQGGDASTEAIMAALSDPWMNDGQQAVAQSMYTQATAPKTQVVNGKLVNTQTGEVVADYGPKESWRPMTADEKATYGIAAGDGAAWSINPETKEVKKEGGSGQTINVGGDSTSGLDKALDAAEGKSWSAYMDAGATSSSAAQDFQVLDQLAQVAPQDPLTGPLLQAFPGINSAGAAFQSVVKRIAPTLRAPGSGATSDIEYEGMLNALPSLSNKPEANKVILAMMRNKAEINQQRGEAVMAYQNSHRTKEDLIAARTKIAEINRRSLLTPDLKAALAALGIDTSAGSSAETPAGVVDPGSTFGTIIGVED